jgi:hypothetical protein
VDVGAPWDICWLGNETPSSHQPTVKKRELHKLTHRRCPCRALTPHHDPWKQGASGDMEMLVVDNLVVREITSTGKQGNDANNAGEREVTSEGSRQPCPGQCLHSPDAASEHLAPILIEHGYFLLLPFERRAAGSYHRTDPRRDLGGVLFPTGVERERDKISTASSM